MAFKIARNRKARRENAIKLSKKAISSLANNELAVHSTLKNGKYYKSTSINTALLRRYFLADRSLALSV